MPFWVNFKGGAGLFVWYCELQRLAVTTNATCILPRRCYLCSADYSANEHILPMNIHGLMTSGAPSIPRRVLQKTINHKSVHRPFRYILEFQQCLSARARAHTHAHTCMHALGGICSCRLDTCGVQTAKNLGAVSQINFLFSFYGRKRSLVVFSSGTWAGDDWRMADWKRRFRLIFGVLSLGDGWIPRGNILFHWLHIKHQQHKTVFRTDWYVLGATAKKIK